MTSNNPEQSNCCKAPITSGGDVRTGFYVCTECQRACDIYVPYESVRRPPEQNKPELVNTKKVEPCDKCSSFTHTLMNSNGGRFCGKCKKPKKAMPPPTEVEVVENLQTVLEELSEPPEPWELEFDEEFLTCDEGKCCSKHQFNPRLAGRLPTVLKAFIRKVHDQAYERGKKEGVMIAFNLIDDSAPKFEEEAKKTDDGETWLLARSLRRVRKWLNLELPKYLTKPSSD